MDPITVLDGINTQLRGLQASARRVGPWQLAPPAAPPLRACKRDQDGPPNVCHPARRLQVSSLPTSSEPTTPSSESPLSLDSTLREWLTEALATNASNPKVYTKLLVSNAAAGSIIGKVHRQQPPCGCCPSRCAANSRSCMRSGQTVCDVLGLNRASNRNGTAKWSSRRG